MFGDAAVAAVVERTRQQWQRLAPLLDARQANGHVRLCHGDLHLRNIVAIDDMPDAVRLSRVRSGHGDDNAGVEGSIVVEKVKKEKKTTGYNVDTEEYVDMFEAGIIDPTKVSRTALQNAASVAGLLLTTEALVTEIPEKKKAAAAPGGGGYGGEDF